MGCLRAQGSSLSKIESSRPRRMSKCSTSDTSLQSVKNQANWAKLNESRCPRNSVSDPTLQQHGVNDRILQPSGTTAVTQHLKQAEKVLHQSTRCGKQGSMDGGAIRPKSIAP